MQNFLGTLSQFYDNATGLFGMPDISFSFVDIVEILIISFLFYHILLWIKNTRAWNLFKGIIVILLFVLVAAIFQMNTILWLAENTLSVGLTALVIIFQPELRKALENLGGKNVLGKLFDFGKVEENKFSDHTIDELIKACYAMGKVKTGALIVIEDEILLNEYVRTGIDIDAMLKGAADARELYKNADFEENEALQYALVRNVLYRSGKKLEMLVNYEPRLSYFAEWWKQLYGESEGKDHKGIWNTSASFSTDLHSLGQMIQDGERTIFETVLNIENPVEEVKISATEDNLDGLNFLAGKSMDYVNKMAMEGTLLAHVEGGVPNIRVTVSNVSAYTFGYMVYFFEYACGVSGYTLGVNPFNQPGVEAYKKNMFALLGKPGYEEKQAELLAKLGK